MRTEEDKEVMHPEAYFAIGDTTVDNTSCLQLPSCIAKPVPALHVCPTNCAINL